MNNLPAEKNRRILIVDDNLAIHDDFRKILSPGSAADALDAAWKIKCEIDSAYQGQEGLQRV